MDGAQLAARLRAEPAGRDLPLVLLTSLDSHLPAEAAKLFAGLHTKPVRSAALRSVLMEILDPASADGPAVPVTDHAPALAARLSVLLAEDNIVNQKVAQGMLHNLGHSVDIVADGHAALDALLAQDYDVVLMDINMPAMDGLDATRAIRAQIPAQRQPRIVAMTASGLPEDRRACAQAGMDDYLLKPVRPAELAKALQSVSHFATANSETTNAETANSETANCGSPALASAVPAVDLEALSRVTIEVGAQSSAQLIEAYLEQADPWIGDLVAAADHGNVYRVGQIAHTLGSSSALLGAQTLADLLAVAERLARSDPPDLDRLVSTASSVAVEYDRVSAALRAERSSPTIPSPADGRQR
jgi:CheY-like chemotaxis protein